MKKRFFAVLLCLVMVLAMIIPASAGEAAPDYGKYSAESPLKLTLSHFAASETNQLHLLAVAFKEKVEAATDGAVQVEIVMGGQLGNDDESLQSVMAGALEMAVNNTPIMSAYYEKFQILDLPYLFKDYDHIYAFLGSDICQTLMAEFGEATGARMLCMQAVGYRNFESSKGFVHSKEDLAGIKTRCTGSSVYVNTWNTWGASAMTMAGSEVLTALQQKTIDACDNVNNVAMADGYYEFAPYISIMEYAVHFNGLTINNALFEGLTPDLQAAISTAAIEAAAERTQALQTGNQDALDKMINNEKGATVEVYELTQEEKDALAEAAASVYEDFAAKYDAQADIDAIKALGE
ncbi:MAG: TRAP transporter substrate-binding protein [Parasporobacterium sp.]|nr:TRAP transporter substrate-binding protein [Parasporobacterium sp.]